MQKLCRLSTYPATGDRSTLLRSHAAKSAECSGQGSPRPRRAPRESRRVSLAQASGYVQLNQYRLLEPIGQGSYGIVKLAYNEEDDTHYVLDDPAEDHLYLVFQLLEGGPVIDIPTENPLSEELARRYIRDALLGVEYLHYQRIAHRDIKPANLLLGEGRVQVADLGACGELAAAGRVSGTVGTPAFRAPEAAAPADKYSGEAADIWSLGVTLYAMVTGKVPWVGSSAVELQRKVLAEPLTYPPKFQPSKQLRHLLSRMLDKEPATRATLQEVKDHEWITDGGKDPLPSEQENCRLVEVTEEDMAQVVTSIPNLSTLILIKTMLKKHSFQNPFLRSREGSTSRRESTSSRGESSEKSTAAAKRGGLARAGRSLSAPGNYLTESRQSSFDIGLESVQESRDQSLDVTAKEKSPQGKEKEESSAR
ncbi:unnamed protein product [Spodoptera littoralis]|uniref:Protein kinase domain-containing protein n=1 Tax=Spodoptera littoralis TaxID=7109 RepID=A0A9P0I3X2_SPOLI|nr:unnamed protein product [Spodoptera littoralis]CAH1640907.1 unnamed protein product [Spodoptera littoralis]